MQHLCFIAECVFLFLVFWNIIHFTCYTVSEIYKLHIHTVTQWYRQQRHAFARFTPSPSDTVVTWYLLEICVTFFVSSAGFWLRLSASLDTTAQKNSQVRCRTWDCPCHLAYEYNPTLFTTTTTKCLNYLHQVFKVNAKTGMMMVVVVMMMINNNKLCC